MKMGDKRGLSEVITTLLIIGLSLAAIVIIWVVIQNIISTGSDQVSLGKFTMDLQIEKVLINPGTLEVTVKRNPGKGELNGLKFIISDGTSTEVLEEKNIQLEELETKTFILAYDGIVKEVSIAPIIIQSSGAETIGDVKDELTFSAENTVKNIPGLVSWWRFEGNAKDEVDGNDGTPESMLTLVDGKYGKAYHFPGGTSLQKIINVSDSDSLTPSSSITISAWVNKKNTERETILDKGMLVSASYSYYLDISSSNNIIFLISNDGTNTGTLTSSGTISLNEWQHVVATWNGTLMKIYINSQEDPTTQSWTTGLNNDANELIIGGAIMPANTKWNGTIDEAMLFNRALSADEIQGIYNLNLG